MPLWLYNLLLRIQRRGLPKDGDAGVLTGDPTSVWENGVVPPSDERPLEEEIAEES